MPDNMLDWLKGHNSKAVDLLDRNHSLASFIAKVCYNFDSYCRDKHLNPYTTQIGDAYITRDNQIVAKIEGK